MVESIVERRLPTAPLDVVVVGGLGLALAVAPVPFVPGVVFVWLLLMPLTGQAMRDRRVAILVGFLALAMAAQFASDSVNHVPLRSLLRGQGKYVGLGAIFISYSWAFLHARISPLWALATAAIGWLGAVAVFPVVTPGYSEWKYGLADPTALLLAVAATALWRNGARTSSGIMMLSGAVVMAVTDYRSLALILGASWLIAVGVRVGSSKHRTRVIVVGVTLVVLVYVFTLVAVHGWLGAAVRDKTIRQGTSPMHVLATARPEIRISVALLPRESFLGKGSDAVATTSDVSTAASAVSDFPAPQRYALLNRVLGKAVDLHSVFFTSLWQGGVLVLPALLFIAAFAVSTLIHIERSVVREWGPLVPFCALTIIWNMVFSPWAYFTGIEIAICTAAVITLIREPTFSRRGGEL